MVQTHIHYRYVPLFGYVLFCSNLKETTYTVHPLVPTTNAPNGPILNLWTPLVGHKTTHLYPLGMQLCTYWGRPSSQHESCGTPPLAATCVLGLTICLPNGSMFLRYGLTLTWGECLNETIYRTLSISQVRPTLCSVVMTLLEGV